MEVPGVGPRLCVQYLKNEQQFFLQQLLGLKYEVIAEYFRLDKALTVRFFFELL